MYLSPQYQNEIAGLLSEQVLDSIRNEFAKKPFSIIVDETTDISSIEQLTFCVRYLDSDYQIKERFLGFYEVRMDFKLYLLKKIFNNIFVILSIA